MTKLSLEELENSRYLIKNCKYQNGFLLMKSFTYILLNQKYFIYFIYILYFMETLHLNSSNEKKK